MINFVELTFSGFPLLLSLIEFCENKAVTQGHYEPSFQFHRNSFQMEFSGHSVDASNL